MNKTPISGEDRAALIRRGNELFNKGDLKNSLKIYLATDYGDGIIRVADYYYFDKNDKITGIKLYKKAHHQKMIDDFAYKAAQIIRMLLAEDQEAVLTARIAAANGESPPELKEMKEWKPVTISQEEIMTLRQAQGDGKKKDEEEKK